MGMAFTPGEREAIRQKLEDAARCCLKGTGMQNVTVQELARTAGISKGAFYRFFVSKEHLFFSLLTHLHNDLYTSAERVLDACADLPIHERTMHAIAEVCRVARENGTVAFSRTELPMLLQRLPESVVREQYMTDEALIEKIILRSGVRLRTDMRTACATLRILLLTCLFEEAIGKNYDEAMRILIAGACDKILA